jgi:alkylhydroperoxidase family enzyme
MEVFRLAIWPFVEEKNMPDDLSELLELANDRGAPKEKLYKILAHSPSQMKAFANIWNTSFFEGEVNHPLKEIVRLRVALHYGCPF